MMPSPSSADSILQACVPPFERTTGTKRWSAHGKCGSAALLEHFQVIILLEVVAILVFRIPAIVRFDLWAFQEWGDDLVVHNLLSRGFRPGIDFGYHYGLLPLIFGRLWFYLFPQLTPFTCWARMALFNLLVAAGVARFVKALRINPAGAVLVLVAMPFIVLDAFPNFAHGIEASLLSHGLAEQAAGRRRNALMLAAMACFAKPTLGYFYGAILVGLTLCELWTNDRLQWFAVSKEISLAVLATSILLFVLGGLFGYGSLFRTLLPITGARAYRAAGYGFFRIGHGFWYHPGARPGYYLGTVVGFWLIGSMWLFVTGVTAVGRLVGRKESLPLRRCYESIASCAGLQLIFIVFLYGAPATWIYYPYVLVMGVAATAELGQASQITVWALALVALVGQKAFLFDGLGNWREMSASAGTLGFREREDERIEWAEVLRLISERPSPQGPVTFLPRAGAVELMFPVFEKPVTLFLEPVVASDADIARKAAQIAESSEVVTMAGGSLVQWPAFRSALSGFRMLHEGRFFDVYIRNIEPPLAPSEVPDRSRGTKNGNFN